MPGGTLVSWRIDNGTLVSPSFTQRVSERENRLPFFRSPELLRPIHDAPKSVPSGLIHPTEELEREVYE